MRRVYLDHNATSPVHPEVREAMLPFLSEHFGNPSSAHWAGRDVRDHVEEARAKVARFIGAKPQEIFFTAGGSEGDNMAIKGILMGHIERGGHVVTTSVEHPAVLKTCRFMRRFGFEVTEVAVDGRGMVDPDDVKKAIRDDTRLVSVMYVNNETGNVFPVREICEIAHGLGVPVHTDAVQAMGKIPVDIGELGVDLLTASGHKFNSPKGIGFQFIREGVNVLPLVSGGHQEGGFRAGTECVHGIVAIGKACEVLGREMRQGGSAVGRLRDRLERAILAEVPETVLNGHPTMRACNTANISFKYVEGEALLMLLDAEGIAVSTGSACASGTSEPSHVLTAMGLEPLCSRGAIRFSLGLGNDDEDIDYCLDAIRSRAVTLLKMSPFARMR